jgi:hypothetical protein
VTYTAHQSNEAHTQSPEGGEAAGEEASDYVQVQVCSPWNWN